MSAIATRFTARFGCKHPFACAGMAFAGMTELALAVCGGGGVGAIGVGLTPAEQLRGLIQEMPKKTSSLALRPLAVTIWYEALPTRHMRVWRDASIFGRLKEFKRIAMRADKTDQGFTASIYLATAVLNSRRFSTDPRQAE